MGIYTHIKTGNKYRLICIANNKPNEEILAEMAVYGDANGDIWSRPIDEFYDKFKKDCE